MHSSYICWERGEEYCNDLGRILWFRYDGTVQPCDCECHKEAWR